jgi:hypothetical protein
MLSYCLIQLHIIHNSNKSITNFKKNSLLQPELGRCCSVVYTTCTFFFGCFPNLSFNIPSVHSQCHASCSISMPGVVHGCVPKSKVHQSVPKSIRACRPRVHLVKRKPETQLLHVFDARWLLAPFGRIFLRIRCPSF